MRVNQDSAPYTIAAILACLTMTVNPWDPRGIHYYILLDRRYIG